MTARETPEPDHGRLDNGLRAVAYVPLTDVDPAMGEHLLTALGRARIAAYLSPTAAEAADRQRLFVASEERVDARTIVAAAVRALGEPAPEMSPDPLAGVDTDAAFEAMVAGWHVDTVSAVRNAERDLTREDAGWRARLAQPPAEDPIWLDDDHYVPPPPPPLPRLAAMTVLAILLIALGIALLGFGNSLGVPGELPIVLGLAALISGVGVLLSRVRDFRRDEDDDGAAI